MTLTFNCTHAKLDQLPVGCNLRGYFNTLNTTSIESQTEAKHLNESREKTSSGASMWTLTMNLGEEMKDEELSEKENKEIDAEYRVYKNFWGIQKYLNNPC